jgi:hypothetical protein
MLLSGGVLFSLLADSAALLGVGLMSPLLNDPTRGSPKRVIPYSEGALRTQIWSVLSAMYPDAGRSDRRREERFPYPNLIRLTPLADDGVTPLNKTFTVAGKHLSERGLGFYHPKPLPYRWVIASLERSPGEWLAFLLDVSWCRFNALGWYESGGRFVRPMAQFEREAALAG